MLRYFSNPTKMVCDISCEKSRQICANLYSQSHVFINLRNVHVPLGLSKIWLFSRNPRVCTFSHGFDHAKNENDDDFAV